MTRLASRYDPGFAALVGRRWRTMGLAMALTLGLGGGALALVPRRFESEARLLVMRTDQRTGGIKILDGDSLPRLDVNDQPIFTQVEILRSDSVMAPVVRQLHLQGPAGAPLPVSALASRVQISPINDTDLIKVAVQAADPLKARRLVAAVCQAYLRRLRAMRQADIQDGVRFLDDELANAHRRLSSAESKLMAFRSSIGGVPLPSEAGANVASLQGLEAELQSNEIALEAAQARAGGLRTQLGISPARFRDRLTLGHDRELQGFEDQLVQAEADPVLTSGLARHNPDWLAARARVNALRARIRKRVRALVGHAMPVEPSDSVREDILTQYGLAEADVQALAATVAATRRKRDELDRQLRKLPDLEETYDRLSRDVSVASDVYVQLLTEREQVTANLSLAPTDVQVVQPATLPTQPLAPLKGLGIPVLLVTGLVAGYLAALARDLFTRPVETSALVSFMGDRAILTRIPTLSRHDLRRGELVSLDDGNPAYVEALRGLAFQIQQGLDRHKVLAIASATSGEGKTVTLANLAACLAEDGLRVLVVDCDLLWQRMYEVFKFEAPGRGLAEVLLGAADPLRIARSGGTVEIVTAGTGIAGIKLGRCREALRRALSVWKEAYDVVLLDLPSLEIFSRAAVFARQADATLLLANLERVPPETVSAAGDQLRGIGTKIAGLLAICKPSADATLPYGQGTHAFAGSLTT